VPREGAAPELVSSRGSDGTHRYSIGSTIAAERIPSLRSDRARVLWNGWPSAGGMGARVGRNAHYAAAEDGDGIVEVSLDAMKETVVAAGTLFSYPSSTLLIGANGSHHVFAGGKQHFVRAGAGWAPEPLQLPR